MSLASFIKKTVLNYFLIFALIVIGTTVVRQFSTGDKSISLNEIYTFLLCALAGDLPSFILYSRRELTKRQSQLRMAIHFTVLEAVLITLGNITGWVHGWLQSVVFFADIGIIYLIVCLFSYNNDRLAARKINERLKEMRQEQANTNLR
ncbi:DUF3021 domain-containing protein [Acetanaerobacterium elongatum]|uniref:DUF3021 domain-containing protein n=1 Tax=Acetanaerobacterium elongatum TaxID=258515 RepID=A0A1H0BPY9_9FIRM|nr:DUF3021 domain-containing protein [Acetanaerobacterium elongatum]SDN47710.1 Protein of unknown function [Acetanaerobacterium elongatum]